MSQQSQQCVIGKFCKSHECYHGQEAEDLRKGVEDLLEEAKSQGLHHEDLSLRKGEDLLDAYNQLVDGLQHLLDTTDAADSLSFVESDDEDDETGAAPAASCPSSGLIGWFCSGSFMSSSLSFWLLRWT